MVNGPEMVKPAWPPLPPPPIPNHGVSLWCNNTRISVHTAAPTGPETHKCSPYQSLGGPASHAMRKYSDLSHSTCYGKFVNFKEHMFKNILMYFKGTFLNYGIKVAESCLSPHK